MALCILIWKRTRASLARCSHSYCWEFQYMHRWSAHWRKGGKCSYFIMEHMSYGSSLKHASDGLAGAPSLFPENPGSLVPGAAGSSNSDINCSSLRVPMTRVGKEVQMALQHSSTSSTSCSLPICQEAGAGHCYSGTPFLPVTAVLLLFARKQGGKGFLRVRGNVKKGHVNASVNGWQQYS